MPAAGDVLLDKIVAYHILCLYVEYNVLCGNKVLLNWKLNWNPPVDLSQRPVTRSFVFFDLRLNKQLSKQSIRRWFETSSLSLWRHCNGIPTPCWQLLGPCFDYMLNACLCSRFSWQRAHGPQKQTVQQSSIMEPCNDRKPMRHIVNITRGAFY